jgi:hypothetical protein
MFAENVPDVGKSRTASRVPFAEPPETMMSRHSGVLVTTHPDTPTRHEFVEEPGETVAETVALPKPALASNGPVRST